MHNDLAASYFLRVKLIQKERHWREDRMCEMEWIDSCAGEKMAKKK